MIDIKESSVALKVEDFLPQLKKLEKIGFEVDYNKGKVFRTASLDIEGQDIMAVMEIVFIEERMEAKLNCFFSPLYMKKSNFYKYHKKTSSFLLAFRKKWNMKPDSQHSVSRTLTSRKDVLLAMEKILPELDKNIHSFFKGITAKPRGSFKI